MLPVVVSEDFATTFQFYLDDCIRQGIRLDSELYGFACEFQVKQRLKAYQLACELTQQGVEVLITASLFRYAVWVNLREPAYLQLTSCRWQSFTEPQTLLPIAS